MDCKQYTRLCEKFEETMAIGNNQTKLNYTSHHHHHHQQQQQQPQLGWQNQALGQASQWQHQPFAAPPTLPIDDFHMTDNPNKYSEEEKQQRIKLAAVYRMIELNGWAMGIYNHVTVKLEKQTDRILIHPFGLHYNEITASSLLKIDMSGNIVDQGTTNFELNRPGYIIHSAIHMARPDLKAIIHLHYPPVSAASACKYGLLPICQEQALLGEISYLDYNGILTQEDERDAVAAGLGDKCKVMILHNHGLIVCGETIEEAYYLLNNLMRACETQARLLALGGIDSLILMNEDAAQQAHDMVMSARYPIKQFVLDDQHESERSDESTTSGNESDFDSQSDHKHKLQIQTKKSLKKKIVGYVTMFELDFEANMRALDLAGHQTGYRFKRPLVRNYKRMLQ